MSDNKIRMRAELFKWAAKGHFPTYGEMLPHLQPQIPQGWRKEWSEDLNKIAMEELSHGYPDITYILRRNDPKSPYPSQILFRDAHNPDSEQLEALHRGVKKIIELYCPAGTPDPYP